MKRLFFSIFLSLLCFSLFTSASSPSTKDNCPSSNCPLRSCRLIRYFLFSISSYIDTRSNNHLSLPQLISFTYYNHPFFLSLLASNSIPDRAIRKFITWLRIRLIAKHNIPSAFFLSSSLLLFHNSISPGSKILFSSPCRIASIR